jgi:hypothetical protein
VRALFPPSTSVALLSLPASELLVFLLAQDSLTFFPSLPPIATQVRTAQSLALSQHLPLGKAQLAVVVKASKAFVRDFNEADEKGVYEAAGEGCVIASFPFLNDSFLSPSTSSPLSFTVDRLIEQRLRAHSVYAIPPAYFLPHTGGKTAPTSSTKPPPSSCPRRRSAFAVFVLSHFFLANLSVSSYPYSDTLSRFRCTYPFSERRRPSFFLSFRTPFSSARGKERSVRDYIARRTQ